jgi:hypothetical protein
MFKVGDKIVRDSGAGHDRFGVVLEKGKAYTVDSIDNDASRLALKEFPEVGQEWSSILWSRYTPTARSNDPATSKVNKYEQAVLDTLRMGADSGKPEGFTGKDIATFTGHPLNCITPRFAPLRRKGFD